LVNRNLWVYDIETLKSCFTYSAINVDTEEVVSYVIHKDQFELLELVQHLQQCKGHIGFNNVNFDYPIIHKLLINWKKWLAKYRNNQEQIITELYQEAQRIIEEQNKVQFNTIVAIKDSEVLIPQLDLFKLWHYNNKARSTSLKSLEISMNYPNVMEMPIDHTRDDITLEEIPSILKYNLNDVLATFEFYKKSLAKISLRKSLNQEYNIPCMNWSDSKIGEQLILKLYCDKTEKDVWEVKKERTYRKSINFKECILDYINFESKEFNELLDYFKKQTITETKGSIEQSVVYKGFKYDYGTGGIHGCIKAGVYESNEDYIIIDADVAQMYPRLAITNKFYPEHLGEVFVNIYEELTIMRAKAKAKGNNSIADAMKLSSNSTYGKSNDINSFLYDPKFTMAITLNGQLLLSVLCERLNNAIPGLQMIQVNTDGITVKIPINFKHVYDKICSDWEIETKLTLEYVEYSKMVIRDVKIGV